MLDASAAPHPEGNRTKVFAVLAAAALAISLPACSSPRSTSEPPRDEPHTSFELEPGDSPADWRVRDPSAITADSRSVEILASRVECASGKTGEIAEVRVLEEESRVVVTVLAAPLEAQSASCQGNDAVPLTFEMQEPLGSRTLVDGVCLNEPYSGYAFCLDGARRYP